MKALPVTLITGLLIFPLLWWISGYVNLVRPGQDSPTPRRLIVKWVSDSHEELLLEGALIDSTPLYLPTYWNFSPPSPSPVHQRQLPPVDGALPSDFLAQSPEAWEQIQPVPERDPQQTTRHLLSSRQTFPYSSFWKIKRIPSYLVQANSLKLTLPVEIRHLKEDILVWNGEIAVADDHPLPRGNILKPVEFRVLITPEGSLGPILMESFTGDSATDEFLRLKIQEHAYWPQALPGYYQVWIGLL